MAMHGKLLRFRLFSTTLDPNPSWPSSRSPKWVSNDLKTPPSVHSTLLLAQNLSTKPSASQNPNAIQKSNKFRLFSTTLDPNPSLPSSSSRKWVSNDLKTPPSVHCALRLAQKLSTKPSAPQNPNPNPKSNKFYIYHGHRTEALDRPIVRGGLFTHTRQKPWTDLPPSKNQQTLNPKPFRTELWDPESFDPKNRILTQNSALELYKSGRRLSALARYVCESFSRHKKWGPQIIADLEKLHRVTPNVVTEVLKVMTDADLASKFFHWANRQRKFKHNFSAYNAFAYCLNRANRYKAAEEIVEVMNAHGKQPSMKQFEIMIRMHADAGRGLRVYYVFMKMKKFGVKPSVFLYNRIMDALVRTEHLDLALDVYGDLVKDGVDPEGITYMILIKGFCREGMMDRVCEFLGEMRSRVCRPDVFAYTAMVKTLVGVGNLEGACRIWGEMSRDGVRPDVKAYTTMISGLCKENEGEKAMKLFKEMKDRGFLIDRAVYGSLIAMYAKNMKVGLGYNLLKEMVKCGYKADLGIYESLIEGFCSERILDKAYKLLQILIQEGVSTEYTTFMPLFWAFVERGSIDDACKLLDQMAQLGRPVKNDVYKFFVFMVCKEEKVTKAVELFELLKEKGHYSVSMFNLLINGLYKDGDIAKALSLFNEMKRAKCEPDVFTCNYIIPCLVESRKLQEACDLFAHMKERSWVPSVTVYTVLVNSLCKIDEINPALSLVQDCLGCTVSAPRVFMYTLRILHECKSGKAEPVLDVLTEMMEESIPLEDIVYCAVISGLCKHGTIEEARNVFWSLRKKKHIPESRALEYDDILLNHMKTTTSELLYCSLKFHGLESLLNPEKAGGT